MISNNFIKNIYIMEGIILPQSIIWPTIKNKTVSLGSDSDSDGSCSDTDSSDTDSSDTDTSNTGSDISDSDGESNSRDLDKLSISTKKQNIKTKSKQIVKTKSKQINKSKKKRKQTNSDDSDSTIDVDDTENDTDTEDQIYKNSDNGDVSDIPVYDGIEPYFIFKRRWDEFILNKNKHIHIKILEFLNKLLNTKYTNLISIKKITYDMIPCPKKFSQILTSDQDYVSTFRIRHGSTIPTVKMLANLLSKINFSFVEVDTGKELYYTVKPKSGIARVSGMNR